MDRYQVAPDCGDFQAYSIYEVATGNKIASIWIRPVPPGSGSDAARLALNADAEAHLLAAKMVYALNRGNR
jgi:hypothetical protein